ncbi:hypothetical protein BH743_10340 [Enterococcus faecium]|nr:hypothetical protein BH743_10340 [Enterococcus faecium]
MLCIFFFFQEEAAYEVQEGFRGSEMCIRGRFYRFEVIDYYKNHFFDNIIFGFGFSDRVKNIYNYTDIGLMGFLFRYGMAISVWIIGLMYYFMKNLNSNIVNKLIFIYFIGMSISLSLFDSQRIIYFPIIFSIFSSSIKRGEMYEL